MSKHAARVVLIILLAAAGWAPAAGAAEGNAGKAFNKLTRGMINTVTGWVEVPKRIHETSTASGAGAGLTWGVLRGLGYGIVRTAAGLYEIVTFPVPAPEGYEPIMLPEYVFTEPEDDGSYE
jgi:putative exosortase-associated protein (TIGR04073 family)